MPAFSTFTQSNLYHWLMACVSGGLLVLSFPKFSYGFLAWIALAPLLFVLGQGNFSLKKSFGLGFVTGWIFFFFSSNWISHSMIRYGGINIVLGYAIAALFTAITALFPGLFGLILGQLQKWLGIKALGLAPFIWVATEWLRAATTDITWNALGISQANNFAVARFAQLGGTAMLSFALVAASMSLILLIEIKSPAIRKIFAVYVLAIASALFLGRDEKSFLVNNSNPPAAEIAVTAVQPNLPVDILTNSDEMAQRNIQGLKNNIKLTREAIERTENKKTDLIIWAESPLVLNYEEDESVRRALNSLVAETQAHLIFSAIARSGEQVYNSAQTIAPEGQALKRYDKIRLLPFGEYVPFRSVLGFFVPPMVGDFTPGNVATVNSMKLRAQEAYIQNQRETEGEIALERTTHFIRTGTFICYEAAYPNLVRQFVKNGATLLINISDDAWFGNSAGAEQHLLHAQMRAIENNRSIVRVTNSGISALIRADGTITEQLPTFSAAGSVWNAQEEKGVTLYTKYGDWLAIFCSVITGIAIILGFVYHSRAKKRT